MRFTLLVIAAAAGLMLVPTARATMLFYDSFDYAPAADPTQHTLANQLGQNYPTTAGGTIPPWMNYSGGNSNPYVASGSLSYPGLVTDTSSGSNDLTYKGTNGSGDAYHFFGQPATWDGSSQPPFTTYSDPASGSTTLYYSMLLRVNQVTDNPSKTGDDGWDNTSGTFPQGQFLTAFMNTTSYTSQTAQTNTAGSLMIKSGDGTQFSNTFQLGVGTTDKTVANFSPSTYGLNQTLLVVVAYTMNAGSNDNVANLYIDPTAGSLESGNTPLATEGSLPTLTLTGFVLKDDQHMPDYGLEIDDLRIGTTWADVTPAVPEPASPSLLGLGGVAAIASRRRRRSNSFPLPCGLHVS